MLEYLSIKTPPQAGKTLLNIEPNLAGTTGSTSALKILATPTQVEQYNKDLQVFISTITTSASVSFVFNDLEIAKTGKFYPITLLAGQNTLVIVVSDGSENITYTMLLNLSAIVKVPTGTLLIAIGHSIPHGKTLGGSSGSAYPALSSDVSDLGYPVLNYAVDGQSIFSMDGEVAQAIASLDFDTYENIVILLHCDVNDIRLGTGGSAVFNKQKEILKTFKDLGCKTILMGCLAYNNIVGSINNDQYYVENLRQKLGALQRKTSLADMYADGYVDINNVTLRPLGRFVGYLDQDTEWFGPTNDGVHPNDYGHLELAIEFSKAMIAVINGGTYGTVSQPQDVTLSSLSFGDLTEVPLFNPVQANVVTEHTISAGADVTELNITAIPTDTTATLQIDNVNVATTGVTVTRPLDTGINYNIISVEKGFNRRIYRITTVVGVVQTIPVAFVTGGLDLTGIDGWQKVSGVGYDVTNKKRVAGTFALVQFAFAYEVNMACGFDISPSANSYQDGSGNYQWTLQVYIDSSSNIIVAQGNTTTNLGVSSYSTNVYQIRIKTDNTAVLMVSHDNTLFEEIHAFTGTFTNDLYVKGYVFVYPNNLFLVRENGLV